MIFEIDVLKGVNDIEFGMSAEEVRIKLSGDFVSYNLTAGISMFKEENPVDYYQGEGVFCHYNSNWYLEAMEFLRPSSLMFGKIDVLGLTMGQGISLLKQMDPDLEVGIDEVTSYRFSLSFRVLDADRGHDEPIESFLTGRPGYYVDDADRR